MSAVPTLQQILNQNEQFSQLSEQPSFTLNDILEEPIDQQIIEDQILGDDDMDGFFQDQEQQDLQSSTQHASRVYKFPSLIQQEESNKQNFSEVNNQNSAKKQQQQKQLQSEEKQVEKQQSKPQIIRTSKILSVQSSKIIPEIPSQQIKRHLRLKQIPMLPLEQINNMSYVLLKNVTNLFQDQRNTQIGIPTAISATGNKFLAVGTSMGNIAVFEIGVKGHKILGTVQQRKYGYVSSLSISRDNKYLVAGHQSGLVAVWDLYYYNLFKQQINSRAKIVQVLFCTQTSENFISNDTEGNTYIYTIQKYIWANLKSQKLLPRSASLFYDIRYHQLQTKNSLLAMCTLDYALLISIKPQIKVIGKITRPDGINSSILPNVQMGRCVIDNLGMRGDAKPMYDVLLVAWGKSFYVYRFIPGVNQTVQIQQIQIYKHQSVIYNIEYLSENIFITLDSHQIFRTIRIDISIPSILQTLEQVERKHHNRHNNNNKSQDNEGSSEIVILNSSNIKSEKLPKVKFSIIHTKQILQEVIYQRLLKNKEQKYIKSFTNTVINCTFNSEHKEIFFITKNSIFRARLHKWTTFLSELVNEQKNVKMAMKMAIQLKNQKLNIFAEKVQILGKKAQKSMNMFCEIGKIFLEEGLKDLKKSNIQRARNLERAEIEVKQIAEELKQLYEYTIEYFIELKCQKYLFQKIYGGIIKNLPSFQYWQLFIEALKPFIIGQTLVKIPSIQIFRQILQYLSEKKSNSPNQDNMKLIDKMIINLESDSLHYEDAVSILSDNKLYKALAYICSVNKDFISPCNKIFYRIVQSSDSKLQNAEKQYFNLLQQYLTKLINGLYINDKKIPQRIYQKHLLGDISLWLSFQDTLEYFLKGNNNITGKDKLSNSFNILLQWIYKLLQQSSKLKQKNHFHELIQHLRQAIESIQNKQLMKKDRGDSFSKRDNIIYLKVQLSLMLIKFGRNIQLSDQEIKFYIKTTYENKVKRIQTPISNIQFVKVELSEQLQFMQKYFEQLHLLNLEGFVQSETGKTAFQSICRTKNDWAKYLYNFLVASLQKRKKLIEQIEEGNRHQEHLDRQYLETISILSNKQPSDISELKSQILLQNHESHAQSEPQPIDKQNSKQMIQSLFLQNNLNFLSTPSQSTILRRRQQLINRIRHLHLVQLPLNENIEELTTPFSRQQNFILVNFILDNSSFQEIDPFIESLIKLNSELVIVYILQHYEVQTVNKKIQMIQNQEVKYFVVRRIIKMLRKIKRSNQKIVSKEGKYFSDSRITVQKSVWGNDHSSYNKKKQSLSASKISSSRLQVDPTSTSLSKQTLLFYIGCLAKYKGQKRVLSELRHNMGQYCDFILQILKIAEQFQLNSCIGLIYQYLKQYKKAFDFYQLVYNERMQVNVRKLVLVQHCHGRFLRKIFNQMLQICQIINTNEQWMKMLEAVLEPLIEENKYLRRKKQQVIQFIQSVYSAKPWHPFIQQLGQVIEITLLQVSSHTPTQQISQVFSQYSQLMNKTFMLNCLKSTMHTYSKSIFIYETSNQLVIKDQANQFEKIYNQNKLKGVNYIPICQACFNLIEYKDKIVAYKCSHMYHKNCILPGQQRCRKCVLVEVGETQSIEYSNYELQQLQNKKKQQQRLQEILSLRKLPSEGSTQKNNINEQAKIHEQKQIENERINTVYRCLGFDEYLERDQMKFDQFRKDYDTYLSKYD